jgi:hypothetical protein
MNKEELFDLILSWENLPLLVREIENHPEKLSDLMEIAFRSDHPKSWRAAWLADKIHDNRPELLLPFIEKMIAALKTETRHGQKRHFLKLISLNAIPQKHYSFLLDYCLNCFTSAGEPVSVRVYALQILFAISEDVPDFKTELLSVIEHELELHPTAGIRSRGKKLAEKLARRIYSV